MSKVNEQLVCDYLESLGFLLKRPRKYQVIAREKAPFEEADWLALNPAMPGWRALPGKRPATGVWGAAELARLPGLVVKVCGWHGDTFTASMLAREPRMWRFAGEESLRAARASLGLDEPVPVLFLPNLPAEPGEREKALDVLRGKGVAGVVLFRTLLLDLLDRIDVKRSYDKSDALQLLRILKAQRLTQTRQMLLETARQPRRRQDKAPSRRKARAAGEAEGGVLPLSAEADLVAEPGLADAPEGEEASP